MNYSFPFCIRHNPESIKTTRLILEIRSSKWIDRVKRYFSDIPSYIEKKIEAWLINPPNDGITLYPNNDIGEIYCFFPDKKISLMDARSDFFRKQEQSLYFIPDDDEIDALEAFCLSSYRYEPYKTTPVICEKIFWVDDKWLVDVLEKKLPLFSAIYHARDLVNAPSQVIYPESFIEEIQKKEWKHFDVHVFWENELKQMGCNLILAVWSGSEKESFMVVFAPKNPPKTKKYALVWKGVTFDAGWIQIKPDKYMLDMKCDMAWGAAVLWVAEYLDTLDVLPVNITIGIWLVENMTWWSAYKPLDVYRAYNGKTVEIHHTDAEGRLVLADVMSYIEKNTKPEHIITIATLTGACIYALGNDIAGIMGDDEQVIQSLLQSNSPYELLWRLPQNDRIKKSLDSDLADIKNISDEEKAGSSLWWAFLSHFQWDALLTHIDIAGPWFRSKPFGYMPKWATGWWVKILSDFFTSYYE